MSISALNTASMPQPQLAPPKEDMKLKETFRQFVGETVFGQLLSSLRSTQGEPAYFHGGRAEKVFQGQLDQELSKQLAAKSADRFADPMFELFMLQQR